MQLAIVSANHVTDAQRKQKKEKKMMIMIHELQRELSVLG